MTTRLVMTIVAATLAAGPAFAQDREVARARCGGRWRGGRRRTPAQARAAAQADRGRDEERAQRDAERDQRDRESDTRRSPARSGALALRSGARPDGLGRWDRAVDGFSRVAAMKGSRADGALYWKAYSQDRVGQRAEALATIAELSKTYPTSRYVKQAQALEMEVRRNVGQPANPEAQADEELKLIALERLAELGSGEGHPDPREDAAGPRLAAGCTTRRCSSWRRATRRAHGRF